MVTIEQLEALDLLLWYRSGHLTAQQSLCDESSISRRLQSTLKAFGLKLRRDHEYTLNGDQRLLESQRYVHQLARFSGISKRPLRLEATHYIAHQLRKPSIPGWLLGPCHHRGYSTLLAMLKQRVIDAWISSDILDAPKGPEFSLIRLWEWPGDLIADSNHPLAHERGLRQADLDHFPSLILPEKLYPALARELHAKGFGHESQLTRYANDSCLGLSVDAMSIGYGSCLSIVSEPKLQRLDWDLGLVGGEVLIVLREWENEPALARLLEDLRTRQIALQQRFPQLCGRL